MDSATSAIDSDEESLVSADSTTSVDERKNFYGISRVSLEKILAEQFGSSKFRASQLYDWVYRKGVTDPLQMTNLGLAFREQLSGVFSFPSLPVVDRAISSDGTRKYLFEVGGDTAVESVMIKQPTRMTLCVSSQVGCGMGCSFCRTATMGFRGNLTPAQIVGQVLGVIEDAKNFDDGFSNIVFMGMGEPLHNFGGISEAIRVLTDDMGLGIAPRRITVSTVGLVPAIKKFFAEELGANLAVSLNATTDEIRSEIMPINRKFKIAELLATLRDAPLKRRKRITIEYVMLGGLNDTKEDLARLPKLLRGLPVKVNLIPYNDNADLGYSTPSKDHVLQWARRLNGTGLDTTVRWSKGADINAACGQLAHQNKSS